MKKRLFRKMSITKIYTSVDDSYNLFLKENSISKCSLAYIFVGKYVKQNVQIMEFIKIEK